MKSLVVNGTSPPHSKAKRFGFGPEKKSANCPSTQHARTFFLELLPQLRSDVTPNLFEIAYQPFISFLDANQDDILSIRRNIEGAPFPTDTAIRIVVYGWSALKHRDTASELCDAFSEWGNRWNLTDEWCLNHAVLTLREQHLSCLSSGMPHPRFTEEAWRTAGFELESDAIFTQAEIIQSFRRKGLHEFTFNHGQISFTVEGPVFKPDIQFKQEVKQEFQALDGPTFRSAGKSLQHRLSDYLEKVRKARNDLNLTAPPSWRKSDQHSEWLVDYQLAPCKTYRQIAREVNKDEKTIREGILRAASLIGLTLRSSEADKRLGRPKGAKDRNARHRVDRRRGQLRGKANYISYFPALLSFREQR